MFLILFHRLIGVHKRAVAFEFFFQLNVECSYFAGKWAHNPFLDTVSFCGRQQSSCGG